MKYRLGDYTVGNWNDWDRVPRDPVTVGSAIFTAAGATTLAASTAASFVLGYLVTTAVTSWALNALAPKPDFGAGTSTGILVNAKDAAAPQDFVYGEIRKGGVVTYYESTGTDNKYLHQIIVLAGHELNSIGDIYVNDQVATINASGYVTNWSSKIFIQKFTGGSGQNVKSTVEGLGAGFAGPENFPANFRGDGIACLYVRYEYNQDVFPNGVPTITAKVQGKKVYDPRSSTTAYSNNAALCIRDFITSSYGLGDSSVDDTSFSAAANECDEDVTLFGSGTEKRYTINGIIRSNRNTGDVLQDLTTACAGTLFWGCGAWKLKVGVYSDPVNAGDPLTLDDLRGPITLDTRVTMRDNFNAVSGTFIDANQDYITADYPQIASTAFKAEDADEEVVLDLPLPYTTSAAMAQRLAKLTLFRGREQMTLNADFGLKAFEYEVGDIIEFTNSRYGFSAKEFEIVGWRLAADQDAGDLRINLTLRETSEAAFDWNAEETAITANNTTLDSGVDTQAPTLDGPTVTTHVNEDGTTVPSITFSWSVDNPELVSYYEFQFKTTGATDYNSRIVYDGEFTLSPALSNTAYNYRVRTFNQLGVKSAFVAGASTVSTGNDSTTPAKPTSLSAAAGYQSITLTWTAPQYNVDAQGDPDPSSPLKDLFQYKIYRGTSTNPTTLVGRVSGEIFTDSGLADGTTYYYRVKAVDFTNNESAFSDNESATTNDALQDVSLYTSLSRDDRFQPSNGLSASLTNMATGTGDYFFMQTTGTVTLADSDDSISSTATMSFDASTQNVNYIGILSPDEDGANSAGQLATLNTIKAGSSQIAYNYNGNKAIFDVTQVFETIDVINDTLYLFKVSHVSGSFAPAGFADGNDVSFEINYQLKGADGTSGGRGAGRWYVGVTSLPTTSSGADTDFTAAIGDPVDLDQAWFYTGTQSAPTAQNVWIYNGSTDTWAEQTEVIDGNLLVDGSVTADQLSATSISALGLTIGTLASDTSGNARLVFEDDLIQVIDASDVVRVKIGNLGP